MKALLLLNVEPAYDGADPAAVRSALQGAGLVVALTPFRDAAVDNADVLLPIAPFSETSGTFVNAEGRVQSFVGVVRPFGEARPVRRLDDRRVPDEQPHCRVQEPAFEIAAPDQHFGRLR